MWRYKGYEHGPAWSALPLTRSIISSFKPVVKLGHKTAAEEDMKKPGAAASEDDQKPRVFNIHELQQGNLCCNSFCEEEPSIIGRLRITTIRVLKCLIATAESE